MEKGNTSRRDFLRSASTTLAAISAVNLGARDFEANAAPIRYPDPDIIVLDPQFKKYKLGNTSIKRLYTGTLWAEGPAWSGTGRYLVWSDIPNDR